MRVGILAVPFLLAGACGGRTSDDRESNPATEVPDASRSDDAASSSACPDGGYDFIACSSGRIVSDCCPPNALCATPATFCDLGGGACVMGPCVDARAVQGEDAAVCQVDGDCHKEHPDECNICEGSTSLVCRHGACLCACEVDGG